MRARRRPAPLAAAAWRLRAFGSGAGRRGEGGRCSLEGVADVPEAEEARRNAPHARHGERELRRRAGVSAPVCTAAGPRAGGAAVASRVDSNSVASRVNSTCVASRVNTRRRAAWATRTAPAQGAGCQW